MKIAFTGSGSTGKSTLLRELQKDPRFKDYKFFDNVTRDVQKKGLVINEKGTDETQLEIMKTHKENLKNENFICTRCALDCWCYSISLYTHRQITDETLEYLGETYGKLINEYDIIFYIRPEFKAVSDGIRNANQSYVDEISDIFEDVVQTDNLPVHILSGSVEERVKQIYDVLKF